MAIFSKHQQLILVFILGMLLSACGGGGGSNPSNTSNNNNVAPTISGTPTTNVTVGQTYSFTPSTNDDNGDTLNFSITNLPSWASFNPVTGQLYGNPITNDIGTYNNITIKVSDGQLATTLLSFNITISSNTQIKDIKISWNMPTTYTDGSLINISDIGGYRLYHGSSKTNLTLLADVNNPGILDFIVNNLSSGTHYFSISSYTLTNIESSLIPPISINI